jgi:hypothetical protein
MEAGRRNHTISDPAVNTVFEQLLMSLHHLAALSAMVQGKLGRGNRDSLNCVISTGPQN